MSVVATEYPKIDFSDERLRNGLRLIMSVDHLVPIVAVNLWYNVGSRNEIAGKTGLAHLFEHMMFEGSANVGKSEHFKLINSIGGFNNAATATYRTNYYEWAPSHELELLLWLEADRMGSLPDALSQETLDNQRDVVKNERRQSFDDPPYATWIEKMHHSLFPEGHPYHHAPIGSMDDLSAASLKDVKDFFKVHYTPNNAVLSIVGDFDPAQARAWVEKYFGGIPSAKTPALPDVEVPLSLGAEVRGSHRERVPAHGVFIGYRSPGQGTRELDAMTMAGAVLSAGRGSRMYQQLVRENLALAAALFTLPQPGVSMTVALGIARPGIFAEVMEAELLKVIDGLKTDEIGEEELNRARAQVERVIIDSLTTVQARADWLSEHATLYDDPGRANERLTDLMSVRPDEIRKVASEVLVKENRSVVTFLPKPPKPKKPKRGA